MVNNKLEGLFSFLETNSIDSQEFAQFTYNLKEEEANAFATVQSLLKMFKRPRELKAGATISILVQKEGKYYIFSEFDGDIQAYKINDDEMIGSTPPTLIVNYDLVEQALLNI